LVIHVAQANYILGSRLSGLKPDIDPSTLPKLTRNDEIVAALEASFAFDHEAIGTITSANAFESVGSRTPSGATIPAHERDRTSRKQQISSRAGSSPEISQGNIAVRYRRQEAYELA
jgi:hypothetical protein